MVACLEWDKAVQKKRWRRSEGRTGDLYNIIIAGDGTTPGWTGL